jgi:hypothetical protein
MFEEVRPSLDLGHEPRGWFRQVGRPNLEVPGPFNRPFDPLTDKIWIEIGNYQLIRMRFQTFVCVDTLHESFTCWNSVDGICNQ